jgi:hypothetical protein
VFIVTGGGALFLGQVKRATCLATAPVPGLHPYSQSTQDHHQGHRSGKATDLFNTN